MCIKERNHDVIAFDDNNKTISNLKKNISPIYEPGLRQIIKESLKKKKITFTNNLSRLNLAKVIVRKGYNI